MTWTTIVSTTIVIAAGVAAGFAAEKVREHEFAAAQPCEANSSDAVTIPGLRTAPLQIELTDVNETIVVSANDNFVEIEFSGQAIRSANLEFLIFAGGGAVKKFRDHRFVLALACDAKEKDGSGTFMTMPALKVVPLVDVNGTIAVTAKDNVVEMRVNGNVVNSQKIELQIAEWLDADRTRELK